MLGLALAPSVSHALSGDRSANPFTEICTASAAGTAPADSSGHAAMRMEHCALCCLSAQPMGMPPAPVTVLPVPEGRAFVTTRFLEASRTLFAWTTAQARAPPHVS